jgi:hypothetical protein
MAVTFALDSTVLGSTDATKAEGVYLGTLTFSGTYSTGGDTLSFAVAGVNAYVAPLRVEVYEQPTTSQTAVGDVFIYAKGTTAANGKLQIFTSSGSQYSGSPGTTFATTTVKARAWFPLGQ